MRITPFVTGIALLGLVATPVSAQDSRRRGREQRDPQGQEQRQEPQQRDRRGQATGRAVPRESVQPAPAQPPRQNSSRPEPNTAPRSNQSRSGNDNGRYDNRAYGNGNYDNRSYDNRGYSNGGRYNNNSHGRPYYPYYSNRGYGQRTIIVPRYISPTFIGVVPYRPYYYRPSIGIGIYYGSGGYYPYGYTPRGYYDPIPGRPYGGLRITGFPREAQVFADGYYVGIVNDFDGIFQAVNLEAGPHKIEIVEPGYQGVEFDVMIQPGRTTTFRY